MSRIGKSMEIENRLVVFRAGGREELGVTDTLIDRSLGAHEMF